jgi:hypothetical protein
VQIEGRLVAASASASATVRRDARPQAALLWKAATWVGLFVLPVLPILLTEYAPLFDYPNHLSRAYVLAVFDDGFAEFFRHAGYLMPNVSADLTLLGLMQVLDPITAGRALLVLITCSTLGGVIALGRASAGRLEPWPAFAALLLLGEMLHWGFLNYLLGLAVLLWGLASWIALGRRSRVAQLACGFVFAWAVYFSHLVAFGLFAVGIAILEIAEARAAIGSRPARDARRRAALRLASSSAIFAPPLGLHLWISASSELPFAARFNFDLYEKLSPLTRLLSSGQPVLDTAVLIAAASFLLYMAWTGQVRLRRKLAMVSAGFALCLILLPYSAMHSFFVDNRTAVAAAFVLMSSMVSRQPGRAERIGWIVLLVLLAIRTAALTGYWSAADREIRGIVRSFDLIDRESVLIAATAVPFEYSAGWFYSRSVNPPHEHTASWATIGRDAIVPAIFAKPGQNPLVLEPPSPTLKRISLGPIPRVIWPRDFKRVAANAAKIRAELDQPGGSGRKVYIVSYDASCEDWSDDLRLRPVVCADDHSILEVERPPTVKSRFLRPGFEPMSPQMCGVCITGKDNS